jgi:hypothetical protein
MRRLGFCFCRMHATICLAHGNWRVDLDYDLRRWGTGVVFAWWAGPWVEAHFLLFRVCVFRLRPSGPKKPLDNRGVAE